MFCLIGQAFLRRMIWPHFNSNGNRGNGEREVPLQSICLHCFPELLTSLQVPGLCCVITISLGFMIFALSRISDMTVPEESL